MTNGATAEATSGGAAARRMPRAADDDSSAPILAILFVCSLAIPVVMNLGPLRMTPYRFLVVLTFAPLAMMWISGRYGRIRPPDIAVAFYAVWNALSLAVNHGVGEQWQLMGITVAEVMGPYLIARAAIRGPKSFRAFVRALFWVTLLIIPIVALEAMFYRRIFQEVLGSMAVYTTSVETRWGMLRAAGPFEHPILFGVFAASGLSLFHYALRGGGRTWPLAAVVSGLGAFFSLSLGAYVAAAAQLGLILYDRISRGIERRWHKLVWVCGSVYLFLLVASNRGPILIFIQTFAFNEFSASIRLQTWRYGTDVVLNHPLFGYGLNDDWPRPPWLTPSVDNFWLLNAMRYGLPSAVAIAFIAFWVLIKVSTRNLTDPESAACRKGLVMTLVALCIAAGTVHYWNTMFCYFMFLLGAGIWTLDRHVEPEPSAPRRGAGRRAADAASASSPAGPAAEAPEPRSETRPGSRGTPDSAAGPVPGTGRGTGPRSRPSDGLPLGTGPRRRR